MNFNYNKAIAALVLLLGVSSVQAQYEDLRNIVKVGGFFQTYSLDGGRTKAAGLNFSYERSISSTISITVDMNFIERIENPEDLENNVPQYNDIVQIKPGMRKYFDKALKGTYMGANAGLGFPKDIGATWELNGIFGYQFRMKRVCIDGGLELGYGSLHYKDDVYYNGVLVSEEKFYGYGFILRPMLKMGYAF